MTDTPPHSVWQGTFHIFGVDVKCHVLSNGQRIIEMDSMNLLIDAMSDPDRLDVKEQTEEFIRWFKTK